MVDIQKILIIIVIAVLFTLFVNVTTDAFVPQPGYNDYCTREPIPKPLLNPRTDDCRPFFPSEDFIKECNAEKGMVQYKHNNSGCAYDAYCETCQNNFKKARTKFSYIEFIISAITGLAAIVLGMNLSVKKNPVNEWVGSGFLLGGILTIFVGTARYFGDFGKYVR
ncbi:hypothetical protein GF327_03370, partial [Candidatus Woesearchaeota archaeon]|nr:hypothetical protein [Candidatus Woesearchaeota archaeon]